MTHILVSEDEPPKREKILAFLKSHRPDAEVAVTASVRETVDYLEERSPDLLLLDMSLPTFSVAGGERGGRPQGAGGIEIMRYMELLDVSCPVIVVTAYPAITIEGHELSLSQLDEKLRADHGDLYRRLVYFNSVYGAWSSELAEAMDDLGI